MLRAGATDPLPHTSHGYALNPDVVGTDIADLTRLHRTALTTDEPAERLRITEEALHLWRGEPALTSFDDEELRVEGRRLLDVRLDLEDVRIDALLALGQFTRASSDLVTLVAAEPLREPRTRQLMVALYWSGRQADALAAYRALRDHLAEELGVDPDADTTALELAILRQDAALSPAIRDRPTPTAPGIVRRLVAPPDPRDIPTPTPQLAQLVADRLAAIDIDAQRWVLKAALLDEHATLPILTDALHASVPEMEHLAAQAAAAGLVRPGGDGVLILRSELRDRLLGGADAPALARASHSAGTALAHHTHEVTGLLRAAWLVVRGGGPWGEVAPIVHRALDALDMAQAAELSADLCAAAAAVAPNATGRAGLLTRLTRALARADRAHEAHVAWVEAVAQARQTGDPEAFALAVLAQEWAFRNLDAPPVTAVDLLREALDRLGPRPSALRLGVLTALIRELVLLSRERVGVPELVAEAEHHAALLDDAESRTTILNTRHILLRACPDLARRRRVADALAEEAPRTQDPERWLPRVWTARLYDSYTAGDYAAAAALHRYLTLFLTANTSPVVPVLRSFSAVPPMRRWHEPSSHWPWPRAATGMPPTPSSMRNWPRPPEAPRSSRRPWPSVRWPTQSCCSAGSTSHRGSPPTWPPSPASGSPSVRSSRVGDRPIGAARS